MTEGRSGAPLRPEDLDDDVPKKYVRRGDDPMLDAAMVKMGAQLRPGEAPFHFALGQDERHPTIPGTARGEGDRAQYVEVAAVPVAHDPTLEQSRVVVAAEDEVTREREEKARPTVKNLPEAVRNLPEQGRVSYDVANSPWRAEEAPEVLAPELLASSHAPRQERDVTPTSRESPTSMAVPVSGRSPVVYGALALALASVLVLAWLGAHGDERRPDATVAVGAPSLAAIAPTEAALAETSVPVALVAPSVPVDLVAPSVTVVGVAVTAPTVAATAATAPRKPPAAATVTPAQGPATATAVAAPLPLPSSAASDALPFGAPRF